MNPTNEWLTSEEAAAYIRRSPMALSQLCSRGHIAYSRPTGGARLFRREDLDEFLNRGRVEAHAAIAAIGDRILSAYEGRRQIPAAEAARER